MAHFGKLRIEGEGISACGYKVFLNDMEISHFLEGLTLHFSPTEINRAEIVLALDHIEVSSEALAALTAIGQAQAEGMRGTSVDLNAPASRV